jgi:RNase adaptor protein for sRNA GlmZ degradation
MMNIINLIIYFIRLIRLYVFMLLSGMTQIIIIIGLPGSGKTYLSKSYEQDDFLIFDDFLSNFYDGVLINFIKNKKKVVLNDPRLCNIKNFERIVNIIKQHTEQFKLILFKNDQENCIKNVKSRNHHERFINDIINYSKVYDLDNYFNYEHEIKDVYQHLKI